MLRRESVEAQTTSTVRGTPAYMSPEQTGRMNRVIDYRTDFYSLGVIFYELLTGRLPFPIADPLGLVHAHIAREPSPPADLRADLPPVVSAIIMKLLAKMAEDRYQSAHGLQADLAHCLAEWQATRTVNPFTLAEHDVSTRFQIPQKLYGREPELETLLAAFDRISSPFELTEDEDKIPPTGGVVQGRTGSQTFEAGGHSTPSQPPPARGRSQYFPPSGGDRGGENSGQPRLSALEPPTGGRQTSNSPRWGVRGAGVSHELDDTAPPPPHCQLSMVNYQLPTFNYGVEVHLRLPQSAPERSGGGPGAGRG